MRLLMIRSGLSPRGLICIQATQKPHKVEGVVYLRPDRVQA
jgi:hypothetical protein